MSQQFGCCGPLLAVARRGSLSLSSLSRLLLHRWTQSRPSQSVGTRLTEAHHDRSHLDRSLPPGRGLGLVPDRGQRDGLYY